MSITDSEKSSIRWSVFSGELVPDEIECPERRATADAAVAELREMVAVAEAQIERGEVYTLEEAMDRVEKHLSERAGKISKSA